MPHYALGHSSRELDRLSAQARLIEPITRDFFTRAGIRAGMRVLDVGSGVGDVSLLLVDLVGDSGQVVGVDRAASAVNVARIRAAKEFHENVTFLQGDPSMMELDGGFDAVVGRYVLQFQRDPAAMLRSIVSHAHPGGIVAFHEIDWGGARSFPPSPVFDRCCEWIVETLQLLGAETRMGTKLHSIFLAAGLPAPSTWLSAVVGGGKVGMHCVELVTDLIESLHPTMARLGVATSQELQLFSRRVRDEVVANETFLVGRYEIGAWSLV
jgi:ubiquinone/menaquinone biosynthesis C-methylase UbiE